MDRVSRPAEKKDSPFIARSMIIAGRSQMDRGLWDAAFPLSEENRIAHITNLLITPTPSIFHFSHFIIAEVDDEPAAALCGYNVKPGSEKNLIYALREMNFDKEQINQFLINMSPFMSCYPDTPEDAWIVECVATLPQFRKRGLADLLLKEIIEKGKSLGYKKFQITVAVGNVAAKQAYLKAGFKEVDVKSTPEFEKAFGISGIERLQMVL